MKRLTILALVFFLGTVALFGQSGAIDIANELSDESTTLAIGKLPSRGQVSVYIDGITSDGRDIPLGAVYSAKTRTALISRMGTRISVVTELSRADFVLRGEVYALGDEAVFAITLEDRRNGTILGGFDTTVSLDADLRRQIATGGGADGSDPYEPNNSAFDGYRIEPGDTLGDVSLGSPGDYDWYLLESPR